MNAINRCETEHGGRSTFNCREDANRIKQTGRPNIDIGTLLATANRVAACHRSHEGPLPTTAGSRQDVAPRTRPLVQ
jgi:hypothetical protein